jgi:hypothetical protein
MYGNTKTFDELTVDHFVWLLEVFFQNLNIKTFDELTVDDFAWVF